MNDNQPAKPAMESHMGGTHLEARRPLTGGSSALDPRLLQDATDLLAMILESSKYGAVALSPMRDSRTGQAYIGIALIHPQDVNDAALNGSGRKMPVALLITGDIQKHMRPIKPGEPGI